MAVPPQEPTTLEGNAKSQLYPAAALRPIGGNVFGVDHPKSRRGKPVKRWVEEINMIENVKEVRGDFDLEAFMERGFFSETRVQVP